MPKEWRPKAQGPKEWRPKAAQGLKEWRPKAQSPEEWKEEPRFPKGMEKGGQDFSQE